MGIELTHTDKIGSILLVLLAAAIFVVTSDFPQGPGETGPDFYPRLVAALIAFFALVQFGRSVVRGEQYAHEIHLDVSVRVIGALALVVAYVLVLPRLGFILATIAFLVATMRYSGVESYGRMAGLSIVLTLVLYYTFVVFLRIPLPAGEVYPVRELLPAVLIGVVF